MKPNKILKREGGQSPRNEKCQVQQILSDFRESRPTQGAAFEHGGNVGSERGPRGYFGVSYTAKQLITH